MKRIILGAAIAAVAAIGFGASASATDDGWSCPGESQKYDNLSGPTYTVQNDSINVWIKAGRDHHEFGPQRSGTVLYVKRVTGHDTSHAHECEPTKPPPTTTPETTVPETTVPETTVPETTVPETTVPETTVPEQTTTTTIEVGDKTTTTTEAPNVTTTAPTPPTTQPRSLPSTGSETTLAILAAAVLGGGLSLARLARRA